MDAKRQQTILNNLEAIRRETDAFIVIGLADDMMFYSVDEMMKPAQVEDLLHKCAPQVSASIVKQRSGGKR